MGNLKSVVPILIALIIAISGSFFIYKWVQNQKPGKIATKEGRVDGMVSVVVALVDLSLGTKITAEMLNTTSFLENSLTPGHFTEKEKVVGRVLIATLKKGEPVLEHRLAPITIETGGISSIVQSGKRAIAVKGDNVIGLSGLINPGNRVDVLVTIKDPDNEKEKTKTVVENIPVLASGSKMVENEKGEPAPVDVYTLEVTPEEGEKIALASTKGRLQFMLRNPSDFNNILTKGTTIPEMLASLTHEKAPEVQAPLPERPKERGTVRKWKPRKSENVVETIRGAALTKEKL